MNDDLGFELDFMTVGDGERSGDAIAIRYGSKTFGHKVLVVDGGSKASGEALVKHITEVYGTDTVDDVVNTHPDCDHASGLSVVLENLKVNRLYLHQPWNHAANIRDRFKDGRITDASLEERIREALNAAHDLEQIAIERNVPIIEPYQGTSIGPFTVLSPEKDWYLDHLVPNFDRTPEAKKVEEDFFGDVLAAVGLLAKAATDTATWIAESIGVETLGEDGVTPPTNESSVILYGELYGKRLLFTGDAGIQALTQAIDYAEARGVSLTGLDYIQVPHHGSRRNVSPSVLDRMMGKTAFVSASPGSTTHPRKKVTNAFIRRGATVYQTRGGALCQPYNRPRRAGYGDAPPIPFSDKVEE